MDGAEAGIKNNLKNNLQKYIFQNYQKLNLSSENNLKVDLDGSEAGIKYF